MSELEERQLTLFQADSHASHLVLPGSSEAIKMTVSSGLKCLELYKNSSRVGCLARMLLESSIWRSTKCFLTWRISDMRLKHLLFQLVPSTPNTDETGFSLWGTPNANMQGEITQERAEELGWKWKGMYWMKPNGTKANTSITHQVMMWPTPTAREWKGARTPESLEKAGRTTTNTLGDAVMATQQGQLNPDWVTWLMGFPDGWLNLTSQESQKELKTEQTS